MLGREPDVPGEEAGANTGVGLVLVPLLGLEDVRSRSSRQNLQRSACTYGP